MNIFNKWLIFLILASFLGQGASAWSMQSDTTRQEIETTLKALEYARMLHKVYDQKFDGYINWYHNNFSLGTDPKQKQTKPGYIIIEGGYGSVVQAIHTPLGIIIPSGHSMGNDRAFEQTGKAIVNLPGVKLKLITPGYESSTGIKGLKFMLMELNGITLVDDSEVPAYEEHEVVYSQKEFKHFNDRFKQRLPLLKSFYKTQDEYHNYPTGNRLFGQTLELAFQTKVLSDNFGIIKGILAAQSSVELADSLDLLGITETDENTFTGFHLKFVKEMWEQDKAKAYCGLLTLLYSNATPNVEKLTAQ